MGLPINEAKAPIACAMPSRAPSTFGSGHTVGKMVGGRGMSAPLNPPVVFLLLVSFFRTLRNFSGRREGN